MQFVGATTNDDRWEGVREKKIGSGLFSPLAAGWSISLPRPSCRVVVKIDSIHGSLESGIHAFLFPFPREGAGGKGGGEGGGEGRGLIKTETFETESPGISLARGFTSAR